MREDRRQGSRRAAAAILGCGLLALTACGRSQADVALPKKPATAVPAFGGGAPAPPSKRDLVIAAYESYWTATNQAINSRNSKTARAMLVTHVPGGAVSRLLAGMSVLWQRHEMAFGAPVFHIKDVTFTGATTAAVHDCIDLSHTGFQNRKTGQIVGGLGQTHDYLTTTLALENGHWLVTGAIPVVQACKY